MNTLALAISTIQRYCPRRSFPKVPYRPGLGPRPVDAHDSDLDAWDGSAKHLLANSEFRWGIDLYNHSYYWEAHEVWEELWILADKQSGARLLVQGLIQCSGAALKALIGQSEGCARLSFKGLAKIESATSEPCFAQLELENFAMKFREFSAARNESAEPPKLVLAR